MFASCGVQFIKGWEATKKEKLKEISASLLPWAWRNKPSIFAPGDLQEDMHINHPARTCPKTQPQSPMSSHLRSCCCRGSSSSLNQCARRHRELYWHSWRRGQRREITFSISSHCALTAACLHVLWCCCNGNLTFWPHSAFGVYLEFSLWHVLYMYTHWHKKNLSTQTEWWKLNKTACVQWLLPDQMDFNVGNTACPISVRYGTPQ